MKSYANPSNYPQRFTHDTTTGEKRPAFRKDNNADFIAFDQNGNNLKIPSKYKVVYAVNHIAKFVPENRAILARITVKGTALEYYYTIEGPVKSEDETKNRTQALFYYVGALMNNSPWYEKLRNEMINKVSTHYEKQLIDAIEMRKIHEL